MFLIIELEIVQEIEWKQTVDDTMGDVTVSKAQERKTTTIETWFAETPLAFFLSPAMSPLC